MERLFQNIGKSFLVPINFFVYLVIFLYLIGYWTGKADLSGVVIFSIADLFANILCGVIVTFTDRNNTRKFDSFYIYGNSEKGRKR